MARIVIQEARQLDLTWDKAANRYVLRLLEGKKYITPKLPLTPLHIVTLMRDGSFELSPWVRLQKDGKEVTLTFLKGNARYAVDWHQFYELAFEERGAEPSNGWKTERV